jgi:hypothetical protein
LLPNKCGVWRIHVILECARPERERHEAQAEGPGNDNWTNPTSALQTIWLRHAEIPEKRGVRVKWEAWVQCASASRNLCSRVLSNLSPQPLPPSGRVRRTSRRFACHAAAPHPGPLPLRGGEGVRWRRWFRNGKHLTVGRLAPPTARTDGRRFPLSPSDGERAGVRGEAVRLA